MHKTRLAFKLEHPEVLVETHGCSFALFTGFVLDTSSKKEIMLLKIKHYLYNAFIIENGNTKIAIDPGLGLSLGRLGSLIPRSEWKGVTHILVTHGDPNHYWFADKMAEVSNAPIICGKRLVKKIGEELFILNP